MPIFARGFLIEREINALALPMFQEMIPRHSDEKRLESSAGCIKKIGLAKQHEKSLLGHFFGNRRISAHAQGEAIHRALRPAIESRKSLLITGLHAPQQIVIGWVRDGFHPVSLDGLCPVPLQIPLGGEESSRI